MRYALLLALAWVGLFHCVGPARAETTAERAVRVLCGPQRAYLAPMVDRAAFFSGVEPLHLAALMYAENHRCDPDRVNRRTGAVGLLQILPEGSANPDHLTALQLKDPATSLALGARHLRRMLRLCGHLGGAVSLYHGNARAYHGPRRCTVDDHARKVLRNVRLLTRRVNERSS